VPESVDPLNRRNHILFDPNDPDAYDRHSLRSIERQSTSSYNHHFRPTIVSRVLPGRISTDMPAVQPSEEQFRGQFNLATDQQRKSLTHHVKTHQSSRLLVYTDADTPEQSLVLQQAYWDKDTLVLETTIPGSVWIIQALEANLNVKLAGSSKQDNVHALHTIPLSTNSTRISTNSSCYTF